MKKNGKRTLTEDEEVVGFVKIDGDKYYDIGGEYERVYVKDGDDYFYYYKTNANADWKKTTTNEDTYNSIVNENAYDLVMMGSETCSNNYSSFTYFDGKYTAESIDAGYGFVLTNIEVTCEGTDVKKIVCSVGDTMYTIENIGVTSVEIPDVQYISVESIKLSETEVTMEFNSSIMLTAEVYPADATESNVRWESDNPKVAEVKDGNVVSGDIEGTATITATADGVSATCTITVVRELPLEEVTREKWVECFNKLEFPLTNYTLISSDATLIADGTNYLYDENYYQHDGDNYYKYTLVDGNWTREMIDEKGYNNFAYKLMSSFLSSFDLGSKYSQFTFENDVYYCPSLRASNYGMEQIKVAFKNGDIFYIQWGADESQSKLSQLGTTVVELLENYTDVQ